MINFFFCKGKQCFPLLILYGIFSILFHEEVHGQSDLDLYSRLSFSVGIEKQSGFEMQQLPYDLIYRHENQTVPSLSIHYDGYRNNHNTLKFGLRTIRIIEKEYFFISQEYSESPYGMNNFITTKTGLEDLRFELISQYEYRFLNSKNSSFFFKA